MKKLAIFIPSFGITNWIRSNRIIAYASPYRYSLAVAFLLLLVTSAIELAKPWPFRIIVDYVIGSQILPLPFELEKRQILLLSAFAIVLTYALSSLIQLISVYTRQNIGKKMVKKIRGELYSHLQRLSLQFHNDSSQADLIYRLTSDTASIQQYYNNGVLPLLSTILSMTGMVIVLIRLDAILAVAAIGILPILLLILRPFLKVLKNRSLLMKQAESEVLGSAQRGISNILIVLAFGQEKYEYDRFIRRSDRGLDSSISFYMAQALYSGIVNIVVGIWVALLIALGATQVMSGRITIGILVVFVSYLAVILISINQASEHVASMRAATAGLDRIFRILDERPVIDSGTLVASQDLFKQPIHFENVSFGYSPSNLVLNKITLTIQPGTKVAIVGPTGAGKSTLMSLIPRFYEPQSGRITIGNSDITNYTTQSLRENIAFVLQPPVLFPGTVLDNVRYGSQDADLNQVVNACKLSQIHSFIVSLPHGYDTFIGERTQQLSQGQKQRLTIARALVRESPLLLLDEPTSAMDPRTEYEVMQCLDQVYRERTAIVIAHRLSTVVTADLIVVMNEGKIEEMGTYQQLLMSGGLFSRLHLHGFGLNQSL